LVTKQGKNYRITHTADIVPQLPWESIGSSICFGCEPYVHISPEYWISSGLGNKANTYKVLNGYSNYSGNAASSFQLNVIAHIQYFQPNMVSLTFHIMLVVRNNLNET
jgi:hypothetical protein